MTETLPPATDEPLPRRRSVTAPAEDLPAEPSGEPRTRATVFEIGGLRVEETATEYAVEVKPGRIVECATLAQAEQLADNSEGRALQRHWYSTEW